MASKPRLTVLSRRSDFLHLLKNGHRVRPSDWLVMNYALNPEGRMRCGWTLPRYVGPAVIRNRLKRWSRVYFRELINSDRIQPVDVNLVFRRTEDDFYKKLDYEKFAQVLERGWGQLQRRVESPASADPRNIQSRGSGPPRGRVPL